MRIAVHVVWWLAISSEGNSGCHIFIKFLMRLNYAEGFVCVEDLLVFLFDSIIDFDGI